ncbi:MAG: ABC transporter ATP-binding protein [Methylococcales bacterium]
MMIEATNLSKRYGDSLALDSLNLKVQAGEIFCLLGANGAGKTTTINLFLNFIAPTSGTARVNGYDAVANTREVRRLVAYLPEQVTLYPKLTGLENLDYFCRLAGQRYIASQQLSFLEQCGLTAAAAKQPLGTYSKGMRQKVGLAIATAKQAKALLLDEPTSGLDPQAAYEFSQTLLALADSGVAVLMATHDLFRVKESGTRAGILKQGRLVSVIDTDQLGAADLERLYLEHMHASTDQREARE